MNQFIHDEDIRRASHSEGVKLGKAEGLKLGEQRGKAEGLKLGEQKEKSLAIRRMLKKLSVDDIVDLGYERSLVEQIAEEADLS